MTKRRHSRRNQKKHISLKEQEAQFHRFMRNDSINFSTYHADVYDWIQNLLELVGQAVGIARRSATSGDTIVAELNRYSERLEREKTKLEKMELRMVVTAPMKAGKSTIINTILGENLLPHRNAAMTAVPSEIRCSPEATVPTVQLEPRLLQAFQNAWREIKRTIMRKGIEEVLKDTAEYSHLESILREIQRSPRYNQIKSKLSGTEQIQEVLGTVNDINRLADLLCPEHVPMRFLSSEDVPSIQAHLWLDSLIPEYGSSGSLVLVDTPGPNEKQNLELASAVDYELERSSMVLLVLDYTQLNTEAASSVKERVQQVLKYLGTQNLFVVVNKIDQRDKGDMTPEEVKTFAKANLGLRDIDIDSRLFEMSASWAFVAARCLRKLRELGSKFSLETAPDEIEALLRARFPVDWEEELQELREFDQEEQLEQIEKFTRRLWKKSGFKDFLDGAIAWLMKGVGFEIVRTSLNVGIQALQEIQEQIDLKKSALGKDAREIQRELDRLEHESFEIQDAQESLRQRTQALLKKNEADMGREKYAIKRNARELVREEFQRMQRASSPVWKRLGRYILRREANVLRFESSSTANAFVQGVTGEVNKSIEHAIRLQLDSLQERFEGFAEEVGNDCSNIIEPILYTAMQHIEDTFEVTLNPPDFELGDFTYQSVSIDVEQDTQQYTVKEKKTRQKRRFWNLWGILPFGGTETYFEKVTKTRDVFEVHLSSVESKALRAVDDHLEELQEKINNFIRKDLGNAISLYISAVQAFLKRYERQLTSVLEEQKMNAQEKEQLKQRLEAISSKTHEQMRLASNWRSELGILH